MTRHTGWARFRLSSLEATRYIPEARKMLGFVLDRCKLGGLTQGELNRTLLDGTVIRARYDGTTPYVDIIAAPSAAIVIDSTVRIAAWVPRGFVLYPASSESRAGWGHPLLGIDDDNRYDAENLSPAVTPTLWTSNGALGEVLLTNLRDAAYPPRTRDPLPIFFEDSDIPDGFFIDAYGRVLRNGTPAPPSIETSAWKCWRMQFDDLLDRETMTPDLLLRAFWEGVAGGQEFLLPLRGYFDRAHRSAKDVRESDYDGGSTITDEDLNSAAEGYRLAEQRARKDGFIPKESEGITRMNGTIAEVTAELASAVDLPSFEPERTELRLAFGVAGRSLAAQQRDQWIAYGARRWYPPPGLGLPILSWDGFPMTNWPAWLVYQFTVGRLPNTPNEDLENVEGPFHGERRPLFSKRLYAWGRIIGELPDTVVAAAIQQREDAWRIIVATRRVSDQLDSVWPSGGGYRPRNSLARLRVYFVDVDRNEGLTMLLRDARVGAYDEVTNPLGWRYADQLRMAPDDEIDGFGAQIYCPLQSPVFDATGTRIVITYDRYFSTGFQRFVVMTETVLTNVDEGVLTTDRTIWGGPAEVPSFNLWFAPSESGLHPNMTYGADYAPADAQFRISIVYEAPAVTNTVPERSARVLRQNNYTTGGIDQLPGDLLLSDFFTQYSNYLYALDVAKNVVANVNHVEGSFQIVWIRDGSTQFSSIFTDPYGIPQSEDVPDEQLQSVELLQPTYARRNAEWVFGFELAPQPTEWPVPAGAFLGSYYQSSVGSLVELTQTPGDDVGYYPVGVV